MQVAVREGSSYSIRRAQLEDLIPIMEVNLKTLPEHYSDFFYEGLLSDFPETFMVAEYWTWARCEFPRCRICNVQMRAWIFKF